MVVKYFWVGRIHPEQLFYKTLFPQEHWLLKDLPKKRILNFHFCCWGYMTMTSLHEAMPDKPSERKVRRNFFAFFSTDVIEAPVLAKKLGSYICMSFFIAYKHWLMELSKDVSFVCKQTSIFGQPICPWQARTCWHVSDVTELIVNLIKHYAAITFIRILVDV